MTTVTKDLVADFGAIGNGNLQFVTANITTTAGGNTLTSVSTNLWTSGDVGKAIAITGVGSSGSLLNTKIASFIDAKHITLNTTTVTAVTNSSQTVSWGTDDTFALQAFNDWAIANQGSDSIVLTIPSGRVIQWLSTVNSSAAANYNSLAIGVKNLTVSGYGATITNGTNTINVWPPFFLGGEGTVVGANGFSARVATVSAGQSQVTLKNPSDVSLFNLGDTAVMEGLDQQGFGEPANPFWYENVKISNISGSVITFSKPLKYTYKDTWPLYNAGDAFHADDGGPATLFAHAGQVWDSTLEYQGLVIDQIAQTIAICRSVTYLDVSFPGVGGGIPTQNENWTANNCDMSGISMEIDKLNGDVTINGGTIFRIDSQSASADNLILNNVTVLSIIQGTPKRFIATGCTIPSLNVGTLSYGRTDEVICTNCTINAFDFKGNLTGHISSAFTMSGGVITCPISFFLQPWAVPGNHVFWTGSLETEGHFTILDVSRDTNNTHVTTSWPGGFPSLPLSADGDLGVRVHPAPKFTMVNCTGCHDVLVLSQAPAGSPLFSFWTETYRIGDTGGVTQPKFRTWGGLGTLTINVTHPYSGAGTLFFHLSDFDNWDVVGTSPYPAFVNAKAGGTRTITSSGPPTGADGADSGLDAQAVIWFGSKSNSGPKYSTDVSGTDPNVSVTVTFRTDQGISTVPPLASSRIRFR